jgi:protein-tyrosine phosphatase
MPKLTRFLGLILLGAASCASPAAEDVADQSGATSSGDEVADCRAGAKEPVDCGTMNLRELGGYVTGDGKKIKASTIFRSEELSRLTPTGQAFVASLGLAFVADFRDDAEIRRGGEDQIAESLRARFKVEDPQASKVEAFAAALGAETGGADQLLALFPNGSARTSMIEGYRNFVTNDASHASFRRFFRDVVAAEKNGKAVLFHCVSGKDRTGFAAAVLLRMLGVPLETIRNDYMLSATFRGPLVDFLVGEQTKKIDDPAKAKEVEALMRAIVGVDVVYLDAAFAAIDSKYGSFEGYVSEGLGLSSYDVDALRSAVLE